MSGEVEAIARMLEEAKQAARELRLRAERAEDLLREVSHEGTVAMSRELRKKILALLNGAAR